MTKLTEAKCIAYRVAGKTAIIAFAWPFYAIDRIFEWMAGAVTLLCAAGASPAVIFYDWCVERHNAARAALKALDAQGVDT